MMMVDEKTLVDRIAGSMALLGGLVPALMTFRNVQDHLGYDVVSAAVVAIVVEGIGFVTITTSLDALRAYQDAQEKSTASWMAAPNPSKAPLMISLIGVVIYLIVVVSVNAILDDGDIWAKISQGLMASFGLLGGLTVAIRNQLEKQAWAIAQTEAAQKEREQQATARADRERQALQQQQAEREKMRLEHEHQENLARIAEDARVKVAKAEAKKAGKLAESFSNSAESFQKVAGAGQKVPETFGKWHDWRKLPESEKKVIATLETPEKVSELYGVPLKTSGNWLANAKKLYSVEEQ